MTESFNRDVKEAEEKFLKDPTFILTPEVAFSRTLSAPEVAPVPKPEVAADAGDEPSTCSGKVSSSLLIFMRENIGGIGGGSIGTSTNLVLRRTHVEVL